jgi:UDP-glucuronate decarboxylase
MKNNIEADIYEVYKLLTKKENIFFKEKKVLLLGSDGFLGKYFKQYFNYLINKKIKVYVDCVDNHISSNIAHKDLLVNKNFIKHYNMDILKFNKKKKYDLIIFLAGIASPTIYKKFPIDSLEVSYLGTKKFLEKSKLEKSLFIYFSSSEVYGNPDIQNIPTKETYYGNVNPFGPRSCYDEGKRVGETLCYIYKNYFKTKLKIIRPFNVFGPAMSKNDDRVIPRFVRALKKKKSLSVYNGGNQTRSFTYIIDALHGFLKVIIKGKEGEIYNVGNDMEEISIFNLAKFISKNVVNNTAIKIKKMTYPSYYPGNEPMRRQPDLKKIRNDTGFYPSIDLKNGLKKFIKYYQ